MRQVLHIVLLCPTLWKIDTLFSQQIGSISTNVIYPPRSTTICCLYCVCVRLLWEIFFWKFSKDQENCILTYLSCPLSVYSIGLLWVRKCEVWKIYTLFIKQIGTIVFLLILYISSTVECVFNLLGLLWVRHCTRWIGLRNSYTGRQSNWKLKRIKKAWFPELLSVVCMVWLTVQRLWCCCFW